MSHGVTDPTTVERLTGLLANIHPNVRAKRMFGGHGVYLGEVFAAVIDNGKAYIKVKGMDEAEIMNLFGNREQPYPAAKNYAHASEEQLHDLAWCKRVRSALEAAGVLPTPA